MDLHELSPGNFQVGPSDAQGDVGTLMYFRPEGKEEKGSSATSPSPQFLQLMGVWDRLSAQIQHIPGDPSVVANAMKVCIGSSPRSLDVLKRGMRLCTRLAELGGGYTSRLDFVNTTTGSLSNGECGLGDVSLDDVAPTTSITTDVIAAAMLADVFPSLKDFPSALVRSKVSREVALVAEDVLKVRQLAGRIDVYEDEAVQAARQMCLAFYDVSAIVVEVVRRVIGIEALVVRGTPADNKVFSNDDMYLHQAEALEAVQLYAPLGHALGLKSLSLALENAALELLFPTSHKKTSEWLDTYVSLHDAILESARQHLEEAIMSDAEFLSKAERVEVQARTKSAISTLKKLLRLGNLQEGGRKREEVFDVLGLRVIVVPKGDSENKVDGINERAAVEACYVVERIVEGMWPAIESRSKDYIASPKPNGYASIHKSVIVADRGVLFDEATTVELQIRTASMHEMAELGNAAHSAYKGGLTVSQTKSLREVQEQKMSELMASAEASVDYDAGEGLFRSIDVNGDGHVSLSELRAVLEELGEDGADRLLERFDLNNDGIISLDEFMEFQKAMGLSSAISLIDEQYAQAVPEVVDGTSVDGVESGSIRLYHNADDARKKGKSVGVNMKRFGTGSSAMHVWGPGSNFMSGMASREPTRAKAMAFTEGDEAGSLHGSLDEPQAPSSKIQGEASNSYRGAKGNVVVLDDSPSSSRKSLEIASDSTSKPHEEVETSDTPATLADTPVKYHNDNGMRRLFSKSGTQEIEATWSIEPVNASAIEVANAAGKPFPPGRIHLPRHGPTILGAVQNRDNDLIVDVPTVSGRHARFEVIRDRVNGMSKCVVMDLGSTNGVWVNRSKITPFKEVSLFPGDVVCFAEPKIAFKIDAKLDIVDTVETSNSSDASSGYFGPAVRAALSVAETLEAQAAAVGIFAPPATRNSISTSSNSTGLADDIYRKLLNKGEFQSAYMLLLGEAMKSPEDGAIWAKLAGIERQRARRKLQNSTVATTRAFLRAAVECFDAIDDQDVRRKSLARVFSTWAMLEFDMRNDGPARIIFQKGVRCLSKVSDTVTDKNELLAKLLCTWASREWKLKDLTVAMRLCTEALDADPNNPFVLTLAGKISAQAGKHHTARQQFQKAIVIDKSYMPALQAWGKMEAELNRMEFARKLFQAAYLVEPDNQYIIQAWAHAEGTSPTGDVTRARELYEECVEAHPTCRAALHGWAKLEDDNGCYAEAKALYERVLALKPTSKRTLSCLGRLERVLGNLDESEALLRRAISIDAQHVASLQELALTLKTKHGKAQMTTESKELTKKVSRINSAYRLQVLRVRKQLNE